MKVNPVLANFGLKPNINRFNFSQKYSTQTAKDIFVKNNGSAPSYKIYSPSFGSKNSFIKTIKTLMTALSDKDPYTYNHSMRVALYTLIFAEELGIPEEQLGEIKAATLLHDIGKITIPNSILQKEDKLTPEEFEIIKTHPVNSKILLQNYKQLKRLLPAIEHHHERWDGKGYPDGLKGAKIPYISRVVAILDTYDAMTSTRSYRKALNHAQSVKEITKHAGTQFDPNLAEEFLKIENIIHHAKNCPNKYYHKYSILERG